MRCILPDQRSVLKLLSVLHVLRTHFNDVRIPDSLPPFQRMEFSQEVYHRIVRHVGTRTDLLSLCSVSKRFQKESERALYNTLHLRGYTRSASLCRLLSSTPRLSALVEALSLFITEDGQEDDDEDDSSEGSAPSVSSSFLDEYWDTVAAALQHTTKLRFLSVYFEHVNDTAHARVLDGCSFQLHTFHCDFEWDTHLAIFLGTQDLLADLYLADYRSEGELHHSSGSSAPSPPPLPKLSFLECTFSEAAIALVPGRPVVRVKTCFSRTKIEEKRTELRELLASLKLSRKPLRALDLASEAYQPEFTLDTLSVMVMMFPASSLRYLGTLVFPVDSKQVRKPAVSYLARLKMQLLQRLEFYARLMRLPRLQCVELEVSEWDPPPMTPAALRALTYELRIYCPSITRIIFVYDFDRVVMNFVDNVCVLDNDSATDTLWREI